VEVPRIVPEIVENVERNLPRNQTRNRKSAARETAAAKCTRRNIGNRIPSEAETLTRVIRPRPAAATVRGLDRCKSDRKRNTESVSDERGRTSARMKTKDHHMM
jgi:hypothetical protein